LNAAAHIKYATEKGLQSMEQGSSNTRRGSSKTKSSAKGKSGRIISDNEKQRISEKIRAKIADSTWHNSFARSRTYDYNGVRLYGKWEVAFAKISTNKKLRRRTFQNGSHR
jgi:hypothetical protein